MNMDKQPTRVLFIGNIPYELNDQQVLGTSINLFTFFLDYHDIKKISY
jgi:hypothetical protein